MFDMLPESPTLEAYAERCLARPAYQRALAMDGGAD
jgi:glutathione S-transferase